GHVPEESDGHASPGPRPKRRTTIVGISASKRVATLAFAAALVAGACSGGSGATTAPASSAAPGASSPAASAGESPSGGGAVTGSIVVSGSSTVQPISEAVSEAFKEENP